MRQFLSFVVICLSFVIVASLSAQVGPGPLILKDEGTAQGAVKSLNCVGAGIACTATGGAGTVTVGGGGSSAFNAITTGTNTTATMVVGSGASETFTGTGIINANRYNGAASIPTTAGGTGVDSSGWSALALITAGAWGQYGGTTACSGSQAVNGLTASGVASCVSIGGTVTWDTIGAAAASKTTANGNNNIVYNVAKTVDNAIAWVFGETSAATNGTSTSGVPNQVLLKVQTVAASTMSPLSVYSRGSHVFSVSPTSAQILATDGTSTVPSYSFAAQPTLGFINNNGNPSIDVVSNGTTLLQFRADTSIVRMNVALWGITGTAAAPSIVNRNSTTDGIFFVAGAVGLSGAGVEVARFVTSGSSQFMTLTATTFANLPAAANGSLIYCSDCDPASLVDSTCTSAGTKTGSHASRVNSTWKCIS